MPWLATRNETVPPVTPQRKQALDEAWRGVAPWAGVVVAAIDIAKLVG
jgi:hypothetical protein